MLNTINRDALIIIPKQPLLDWVNYIYPEAPVTLESLGKHDHGNVYLIPETDHPDDALNYLRENLELYFETELFDWCTDDKLWPKPLTWDLFERWFDYSIQSVVVDMAKGPIMKDEY